MAPTPVTWNRNNYYTINLGGFAGFTSHGYLVLDNSPSKFKITNSINPNQRTDMLKPVRIYSGHDAWWKGAKDRVMIKKTDEGFYWQIEPVQPIQPTDEEFKAKIRHIETGMYVGAIKLKSPNAGSTYFVTVVNKAKASVITIKNTRR